MTGNLPHKFLRVCVGIFEKFSAYGNRHFEVYLIDVYAILWLFHYNFPGNPACEIEHRQRRIDFPLHKLAALSVEIYQPNRIFACPIALLDFPSPSIYQYFSNLQQYQLCQQELCGNCYDTRYTDFVCVEAMGTLLQPDYITQKFQQILIKYGLRKICCHDLRHSCTTIMLYLRYTLKDIQIWLGHSNYNFTADTYIHSGNGVYEQMAARLSEELKIALPPNPILIGDLSMR